MNDNHFMNGFADELTKEAAHPLFKSITRGGTLLGKKVRGMMTKVKKRSKKLSKKIRFKKKAEAPPLPKPPAPATGAPVTTVPPPVKAKAVGGPALSAGAKAVKPKSPAQPKGVQFGGGTGNFEGKQAPSFTDKINPTDTPGAFKRR